MRPSLAFASIAFIAAASHEAAAAPRPTAASFRKLVECRAIANDQARLACLDREVDALTAATQSGDVVVADKAQIREQKKAGFGLGEGTRRIIVEDAVETPTEISSTIAGLRDRGYGAWDYTLQNGMRWRQVEAVGNLPRVGQAVTIRKASLGSYFLKVGSHQAVRVIRLQ